ncbi:MAG TPA: ATP-binding protein [bacterium]|nr:ATP-binding protein [bacterium]
MTRKAAQRTRAAPPIDGEAALQARIKALELELEQKNVLLEQGFAAFTQAAEKLQESYKDLQGQVADLNLELSEKNQELERNLEEREKVKTYLSNIFESLPVGVFVTDLQGAITSINRAGLEMIGATAEAIVGLGVNEVLEAEIFAVDGTGPEPDGAAYDLDEPLTYHRPDGETLHLQISLTQMTGEGRPLGYILNAQDVTLLKQLEEQAERRNRFTAMGEMAATIAHEIRNPLGSIELFASLVKKGLADEEKLALMNHISSGIANMNHIISNVLEYTKPRPVNLRTLDLHRLLHEMGEFSRYMAEQNGVELVYDLGEQPARVRGDEDLLKQVFHNLLLNAVQAMPEGGCVTFASRRRTVTNGKELARFGDVPVHEGAALDVVEVGVRDTGPGIPKEVQRKIFDPFFTTKARGTGLGLAIVHNIIESHHATVDVVSGEGKGTEFIFMFPLIAAQ